MDSSERIERPTILFTFTNGWGVRNFLHTGILEKLAETFRIVAVTTVALKPALEQFGKYDNVVIHEISEEPEKLVWKIIRRAKKYVICLQHNLSTQRIKWVGSGQSRVSQILRRTIWSIAGRLAWNWEVNFLERIEKAYLSDSTPEGLKFVELAVSTSPFDYRDSQLLLSLNRLGTRTVSILPSWDNLSSKGSIQTFSDIFLVWGMWQKKELLNLYPNIDPNTVKSCGLPQFDIYQSDLGEKFSRVAFCQMFGINEDSRIVMYASSAPRWFPNEVEIVEDIVDAVEKGEFGENVFILLRCHPADNGTRFSSVLTSQFLRICDSSRASSKSLYSWIPPEDELSLLAATLRYSDVCINVASTMTLDAMANRTPVVNVAYDGEEKKEYFKSVKRFYDHHHYRFIVDTNCVSIVRDRRALIVEIKEALDGNRYYEDARNRVVSEMCYKPESGARQAFIDELTSFIGKDAGNFQRISK